MPVAWQEYLGRRRGIREEAKTRAIFPMRPYADPLGSKRSDAIPAGGPAGSDIALLRSQLLDGEGVSRALLCHDTAALVGAMSNHYLAGEVARAINDWTAEVWLESDARLHAAVVVASQLPDEAAREIRRACRHPRAAAVLLSGNGLGKPFGHPLYQPIYAAAVEAGVPVVIAAGGDAPLETPTETSAGGVPTTFAEYRILAAQPVMSHLVSLIAQGVFDRFPSLRVLVTGVGVAWLPALMWRMEANYLAGRREVPWLTRSSVVDYFREHVRIGTYPVDRPPDPLSLQRLLRAVPGCEEMLCFSSGYPDRDSDRVAEVAGLIPSEWHRRVFSDNAAQLFGWKIVEETAT